MKILIADDEIVPRKTLQKTLESLGHEVVVAASGTEAWELFEAEGGFGMVLTDWMMPELDGPELCQRIKKHDRTGENPSYVILMTARDYRQSVAEGLNSGADDFISKTADMRELEARLNAGKRILELQQKNIAMRREMEQLAMTDSLTSLLNRRALVDSLRRDEDRLRRENRPFGIVLTDIDHFKRFNDSYGHEAGDRLLKLVADCLKGSVRGGDYVGRWGGEEFLIVLPSADIIQSAEVAERCRSLLEKQTLTTDDGRVLKVTGSFGAASTEGVDRVDVLSLVQQADKAMYWAKEGGRNRVKIYIASADQTRGSQERR